MKKSPPVNATEGVIVATYWEGEHPREMTLSVDHPNGTHTLVIVLIDRMTIPLHGPSRLSRRRR